MIFVLLCLIGDIVKAVTETGISDMLSDLLTFLLTSVFSLQEQEQEEGEDDEQEKDKAVGKVTRGERCVTK